MTELKEYFGPEHKKNKRKGFPYDEAPSKVFFSMTCCKCGTSEETSDVYVGLRCDKFKCSKCKGGNND